MEIISRETVYSGKFLRLVNKTFKYREGRISVWETVERTNTRMAAVIIAITRDNEIILEKNWRAPIEGYVIQLPAGLMDKEGERPEDTARRELMEETGYLAGEVVSICDAVEDPVLTPTKISHFFARNVEYVGKNNPDLEEQIEVLRIPLPELADFLGNLPDNVVLDLRVTGILWIMEKRGLLKF